MQDVIVHDFIDDIMSRGRGMLMVKFNVASAHQNVAVYPNDRRSSPGHEVERLILCGCGSSFSAAICNDGLFQKKSTPPGQMGSFFNPPSHLDFLKHKTPPPVWIFKTKDPPPAWISRKKI